MTFKEDGVSVGLCSNVASQLQRRDQYAIPDLATLINVGDVLQKKKAAADFNLVSLGLESLEIGTTRDQCM